MSLEAIKEVISAFPGKWIVWTGGEPTMQLNADIVSYFKDYKQAIETNGTNPVPKGIDYITCSPKKEVHIQTLKENFPQGVDEFRYPLDVTSKLPNIKDLPPALNYYVSPIFLGEAKKRFELNDSNVQLCIDFVKQNPQWKLSLQIHKILNIR